MPQEQARALEQVFNSKPSGNHIWPSESHTLNFTCLTYEHVVTQNEVDMQDDQMPITSRCGPARVCVAIKCNCAFWRSGSLSCPFPLVVPQVLRSVRVKDEPRRREAQQCPIHPNQLGRVFPHSCPIQREVACNARTPFQVTRQSWRVCTS